jgi:hypothetical protein
MTPSEAERHFEAGLERMKAGDYAVACPMLAESHRLDPLPGVLFTLAECEALWGKFASALEHYTSFTRSLTAMDSARRAVYEERLGIAPKSLRWVFQLRRSRSTLLPRVQRTSK